MSHTLEGMFSCARCKTVDKKFTVLGREPEQDVMAWMKTVQEAMSAAHRQEAPFCTATTCDLKILVGKGEGAYIGGPVEER